VDARDAEIKRLEAETARAHQRLIDAGVVHAKLVAKQKETERARRVELALAERVEASAVGNVVVTHCLALF
jgi:hypothetical protein